MIDAGPFLRHLQRLFPKRQIYIRCVGQVQFFTFTTAFQAMFAFVGLIFLMWAAYATGLVVFKDRSVAALDDRYRLTQAAYQRRLTNLQDAYVELTSSFGQAKRRFDFASQDVTTKQGLIAALLNLENGDEMSFEPSANDLPTSSLPNQLSEVAPIYELGPDIPRVLYHGNDRGVAKYGSDLISGVFLGLIDLHSIRIPSLASTTIGSLSSRQRTPDAEAEVPYNPVLPALERQIDRLQVIDRAEVGVLADTQTVFDRRQDILRGLIRRSHIEPDQYLGRLEAGQALGGPEISIDQVRIAGITDANFTAAYLRTSAVLDHLSGVFEAMKHFPLAMPVAGRFEPTSGFGPRLDPFTGHTAFHPGLDFGGPMGMPIFATASGRVVFTGNRGSYGNVVEIDHGMGFHTRYAHLSGISVRPNSFVAKGALIGRVGSTGRSTGPHLHYEVWYDDVVRDPAPFIVAGRSSAEAGVALKGPE